MSLTKKPAGGWLVTYADLMTILVCFFVLIISYSIQDQVKMEVVAGSMRNAFGVAEQRRYAGDIALDGVPEEEQPGNIRPTPMPSAAGITSTATEDPAIGDHGRDGAFEAANADNRRRLRDAKNALENAILTHPLLNESADNLRINFIDNGLQVLLIDSGSTPMFDLGSKALTPRAEALLRETAGVINPLPNRITITGHADATGSGTYSAFELTAARANAARQILENEGFPEDRINGVAGKASAEPLFPADPYADGNRRIEILLEPAAPLLPADRSL